MQRINKPQKKDWENIFQRPTQTLEDIESTVNEVFSEIKKKGDEAVAKYTLLFDGVSMESFEVPQKEIAQAESAMPENLKEAILLAHGNISRFHIAQKTERISVTTSPGVECWQEKRPIEKVGLYIPGGTAPLFSTILMLAIPAKIAGCKEIILCTPPEGSGKINPAILYTASLCGITRIFKIGGIQAIGALTFGTQSVPGVYKIFGPGNQFVTVAKQLATKHHVAIDMPAGPSELLVVADDSAKAAFVASDLLSQAEHGQDSQVILISTSEKLLHSVESEINLQINDLPRKDIAKKSMAHCRLILVESDPVALEMINKYAPEHVIICAENEDYFIRGIINAGSVFIGNYTPESAGDYASGTNHTLPTNGYARQYSGVNLDSFNKSMTFQRISPEGIKNIGPAIELMAEAEGLKAHSNAVSLRLKDLNETNTSQNL